MCRGRWLLFVHSEGSECGILATTESCCRTAGRYTFVRRRVCNRMSPDGPVFAWGHLAGNREPTHHGARAPRTVRSVLATWCICAARTAAGRRKASVRPEPWSPGWAGGVVHGRLGCALPSRVLGSKWADGGPRGSLPGIRPALSVEHVALDHSHTLGVEMIEKEIFFF